ncbi:MAG: S8 family serine peptidase, partial [Planctomycetota bacterium]
MTSRHLKGGIAWLTCAWGALAAMVPCAAGAAPGQARRVLHPVLREELLRRLPRGRSPFLLEPRAGRLLVRVHTLEPDALLRRAPGLGANVRAIVGGVASVLAPAPALGALAGLPGVVSIKPAHSYTPELDISTVEIGADAAAASYRGTGRGVIVAVIDTGLDFRHPDVRNPDGTTRVLAAWDQTDSGGGQGCGGGIDFGRCWSRQELDADLAGGAPAGLRDGHGHGTHVAGIAAGNGMATANGVPAGTYAGVAPEADLLIVKVFTDSGSFAGDLTAAYAWIAGQAAGTGRPFVINMSLGSDFGAHDGTDPDELALDALLAPGVSGRSAAIAAGNSRGAGVHVEAAVAAGGANPHAFRIPAYDPSPGSDNDAIFFDLWYEGGDALGMSLLDPDGAPLAHADPGAATGLICTGSGAVLIDATNTADPDNLDGEIVVSIWDSSACPVPVPPAPASTMTLLVDGVSTPQGGRYHVWAEGFLGPGLRPRFDPAVESTLVGIPATARRAVAAGSHVTRGCWPSADPNGATTCFATSAPLGAASSFSSNGPTRDG